MSRTRDFSMVLLAVVAITGFSVVGTGCGTDPVDSGSVSETTTVESIASELLIDPTVDFGASGRPVVLWFWAPG